MSSRGVGQRGADLPAACAPLHPADRQTSSTRTRELVAQPQPEGGERPDQHGAATRTTRRRRRGNEDIAQEFGAARASPCPPSADLLAQPHARARARARSPAAPWPPSPLSALTTLRLGGPLRGFWTPPPRRSWSRSCARRTRPASRCSSSPGAATSWSRTRASRDGRARRDARRRAAPALGRPRLPSTSRRARSGTRSWRSASSHGLAGIEALSGIPGSVGATPIQNVGAYGQEVADVITGVRALDRSTGEIPRP